jgi:transposase-like protein
MPRLISPEVKAKVSIDALKEEMTWAQICSKHKVARVQINRWQKEAEKHILSGFRGGQDKIVVELREKNEELLKLLGEMQLENAWLKKKSSFIAD